MKKGFLLVCFTLLLLSAIRVDASFVKKDTATADSAVQVMPTPTEMKDAAKAFNSLSRSEKRSRIKEMKKALKDFAAQKKAGDDISANTVLLVVLSIFIPPLAVYLHEGEINSKFWISVLLTILGYLLFGFAGILFLGSLPGIIYALIVVLSS